MPHSRGGMVRAIRGMIPSQLMKAWTTPQDHLGGIIGRVGSRSLRPQQTYEGADVFEGALGEESPPMAMGNNILLPKGRDLKFWMENDPTSLEHEIRHRDQSEVLGPAYLPVSLLGGMFGEDHPLEVDAYESEPNVLPSGRPNDAKNIQTRYRGAPGKFFAKMRGLLPQGR